MQGSVQGCIRRFMLQKEAGCARLLPQRVGSSGLLSDTQGNGHGEPCAESIHHMGDTLRLIMDLAGLQDESVHAESHGPLRRLDNLSLVKTVTFQGRIRRTQAAVSAVPFATVREFDQASIHGDRVLRAIDDAEEARLAVFTVYDFRRGLALAQHVEGAYLHAFAAIDTTFSVYGKDGHGELRFLLRMKWIAGPSGGGRPAHSVRTFQAGWVRLRPRSCHP